MSMGGLHHLVFYSVFFFIVLKCLLWCFTFWSDLFLDIFKVLVNRTLSWFLSLQICHWHTEKLKQFYVDFVSCYFIENAYWIQGMFHLVFKVFKSRIKMSSSGSVLIIPFLFLSILFLSLILLPHRRLQALYWVRVEISHHLSHFSPFEIDWQQVCHRL